MYAIRSYYDRPAEAADSERYQTVYAREPGAVAAPTAGLHFDTVLLERLVKTGIDRITSYNVCYTKLLRSPSHPF